jgi:hypothetical protein
MADVQWRHFSKMPSHLLVELDEPDQFFGPMKGEDGSTASVRLQGIRELRDFAGGLVSEGERQTIVRQGLRQAVKVFARLRFDASERVTLWLGFNHTDGPGVGVEHVVGIAGGQWEFTNSNTQPRRDIHFAEILHSPASLLKLVVNCPPGFLLWCHRNAFLSRLVLDLTLNMDIAVVFPELQLNRLQSVLVGTRLVSGNRINSNSGGLGSADVS